MTTSDGPGNVTGSADDASALRNKMDSIVRRLRSDAEFRARLTESPQRILSQEGIDAAASEDIETETGICCYVTGCNMTCYFSCFFTTPR
jgi:hypothetical protein